MFRLLFVDAACCLAVVSLAERHSSASWKLMLLDFPLPKRQSGIFTSKTRLPLPAPECESHFPLGNLELSFLFECGIVFVEFPSRKHGIKGALQKFQYSHVRAEEEYYLSHNSRTCNKRVIECNKV